jgi:hypothetical protein
MDVEKVVRQVGLGILRQYMVGSRPHRSHPSFDPKFPTLFLVGNLQSDPISEDEFMTKWNTAVGNAFISNASLNGKYPLPISASSLLNVTSCDPTKAFPTSRLPTIQNPEDS